MWSGGGIKTNCITIIRQCLLIWTRISTNCQEMSRRVITFISESQQVFAKITNATTWGVMWCVKPAKTQSVLYYILWWNDLIVLNLPSHHWRCSWHLGRTRPRTLSGCCPRCPTYNWMGHWCCPGHSSCVQKSSSGVFNKETANWWVACEDTN